MQILSEQPHGLPSAMYVPIGCVHMISQNVEMGMLCHNVSQ